MVAIFIIYFLPSEEYSLMGPQIVDRRLGFSVDFEAQLLVEFGLTNVDCDFVENPMRVGCCGN